MSARVAMLVLLLAALLEAQELELRGPDRAVLPFGERAVLELRLPAGAGRAELGPLPALAGLEITVGGPRDRDGLRSWSVGLMARRPGRYRLPAFAVELEGRRLESAPLDLDFEPEPAAADHAALHLEVDRARVHVGEIIELRLVLEIDRDFLARSVLQPFGRPLDLPVTLFAPALAGDDDLEALAWAEGSASLVVNDLQRHARRLDDERIGWSRLLLSRRFRVRRAGPLRLPPVVLRFDLATRFEEDFLGNRQPLDRQRGRVYSEALEVDARPLLPAPAELGTWSGAIGRYEIEAIVPDRELERSEVFTVDLVVRGEGDLSAIEAPALDLPGFHEYGRRALPGSSPGSRVFRYDLAVIDPSVEALPELRLVHFDPEGEGGYRVARCGPTPLRLRPADDGGIAPTSPARPLVADGLRGLASTSSSRARPGRLSATSVWFALALPILVAFVAVTWLERRDRDRRDPASARARRAHRRLRRALRREGGARDEILVDYLGDRLDRPAPALVRHDLGAELRRCGLSDELAAAAAGLHRRLIAARYGGPASGVPVEIEVELRALVDRIERSRNEGGRP